jgi:outer membrane receptor protein involved in Fe transport
MKFFKLSVVLVVILLCFPQTGLTQNMDESEKESPIVLEEIIVTESRRETLLKDSAQSVTVITSEDIERSSAQKIDELLKEIPGVDSRHYWGADNCETGNITLRGTGTAMGRILVLVDGVPQHDATQEFVRWNLLPLHIVERIEVIRGPSSTLYGSKAMGGVINIITKKPTKSSESFIETSYGTHSTLTGKFYQMGKQGRFGYSIDGFAFKTDGYTPEKNPYDFSIRRDMEDEVIRGKLYWDIGENSTLTLGMKYLEEERGHGREYAECIRETSGVWMDFEQKDYDLRVQMYYDHDKWYYYEDSWEDMYNSRYVDGVADPFGSFGALVTSGMPITDTNIITFGVEGRMQELEWNKVYPHQPLRYSNMGGKKQYLGGFVQDKWHLYNNKLILTGGVRYDWSEFFDGWASDNDPPAPETAYDFEYPSKDSGAWSPKISAVFHVSDKTTLKSSVAKAFRFPSLETLYVYWPWAGGLWQGNPDLKPEKLINYEIGVEQSIIDNKLTGSLTAYRSNAKDYIFNETKSTSPVVQQFENLGRVKIYGVEAELKFKTHKYWHAGLQYTYNVSRIEKYEGNEDIEGKILPYTPKHKVGISLSYNNPDLIGINIFSRWQSNTYDEIDWQKLSAYWVHNVNISRKLNKNTECFVEVENLFNKKYDLFYEEIYSQKLLVAPGLLITSGLKVTF